MLGTARPRGAGPGAGRRRSATARSAARGRRAARSTSATRRPSAAALRALGPRVDRELRRLHRGRPRGAEPDARVARQRRGAAGAGRGRAEAGALARPRLARLRLRRTKARAPTSRPIATNPLCAYGGASRPASARPRTRSAARDRAHAVALRARGKHFPGTILRLAREGKPLRVVRRPGRRRRPRARPRGGDRPHPRRAASTGTIHAASRGQATLVRVRAGVLARAGVQRARSTPCTTAEFPPPREAAARTPSCATRVLAATSGTRCGRGRNALAAFYRHERTAHDHDPRHRRRRLHRQQLRAAPAPRREPDVARRQPRPLTYSGQPREPRRRRGRPALPLRARATSPTRAALAAALGGGRRRDRALRGRVPRRPLDRGRRRVRPDERPRDAGAARPRARAEGAAVRARLDRRGLRLARRRRAASPRRRRSRPNTPYSASKAASDLLVRAADHTHGCPRSITRCSNNYGPYQFPEKLIPLMIANALEGRRAAGLRRRPAGARLDPRRGPLPRPRGRPQAREAGRGLQHRRGQRVDEPRRRAAGPARARQARDR